MHDERSGHPTLVGIALVHAERSIAQVGPASAGARGPASEASPLFVIVHAGFGIPVVLGKEAAPVMHAGAGYAVVDHKEDERVVQAAGGFELVHDPTNVLVHPVDDG